MTDLVLGLAIALAGALLLAGGVELQSRAVYAAGGRWRTYLRSRSWTAGLALLAMAVLTNLAALALAPVSAVQAMNIVALAASAGVSGLTRRIVVTRSVMLSILASIGGVLGFIAVLAAHPGEDIRPVLDGRLPVVMTIQAALTAAGAAVVLRGRRSRGGLTHLVGLVVAAMTFASITTVVKVHVDLVLRDGPITTLTGARSILALLVLACGAMIAGVLLQRAHHVHPAPAVVAGMTITDTITAAVIGILVLQESAPTPPAVLLLLTFGAVAIAGVSGLRGLRRAPEVEPSPGREKNLHHASPRRP